MINDSMCNCIDVFVNHAVDEISDHVLIHKCILIRCQSESRSFGIPKFRIIHSTSNFYLYQSFYFVLRITTAVIRSSITNKKHVVGATQSFKYKSVPTLSASKFKINKKLWLYETTIILKRTIKFASNFCVEINHLEDV